jgi:hypothetical protein
VRWGAKPTTTVAVEFENFGVTRYTIEAAGGAKPGSTFRYGDGLVVTAALRGATWAGQATDAGEVTPFAVGVDVPSDAMPLPSVVARWIGVGSTQTAGTVARYVALPEDGFGAWRIPRKQWFPVMNAHPNTVCDVVVAPVEPVLFGRSERPTRPLNHVDGAGNVVARLLLDPDTSEPLRYEQLGCVLTLVGEDKARSRAPKS